MEEVVKEPPASQAVVPLLDGLLIEATPTVLPLLMLHPGTKKCCLKLKVVLPLAIGDIAACGR